MIGKGNGIGDSSITNTMKLAGKINSPTFTKTSSSIPHGLLILMSANFKVIDIG